MKTRATDPQIKFTTVDSTTVGGPATSQAQPSLQAEDRSAGSQTKLHDPSNGTAASEASRALHDKRPTSSTPFGAHSFSTDELSTQRFLQALTERGVPARIITLLADDLQPAANETRLRELVEATYDRPADRAAIIDALDVAKRAHEGQFQKRKSEKTGLEHIPYLNHPVRVALMAIELGLSAEVAQASLLHDVVEDTKVTVEDLAKRFSPAVLDLVADLTKLNTETRAEYLDRVAKLGGESSTVKCLDRIHNLLRAFSTQDPDYIARYQKETDEIYVPKMAKNEALAPLRALFDMLLTDLEGYRQTLTRS